MAKSKKLMVPNVMGGPEEMNQFLRILSGETDRGAALVGGAYLDVQLEELFRGALRDDPEIVDEVLRFEQPLGTYSARYKMAYLLKLITREEHDLLKEIGRIRNDFAHNVLNQLFDEPAMRDRCRNLKGIDRMWAELDEDSKDKMAREKGISRSRLEFESAINWITIKLWTRLVFVTQAGDIE